MYPKNYKNKYTTIQCTKLYCPRFGLSTFCMSTFLVGRCFDMSTFWFGLVCRRFGLSTFRSVDALVCWCFGMSTFWFVDASVYRRFGLSTFRYPSVSVCLRFGCRRFGFSTFWPATYKRSTLTYQILFIIMVIICSRHIRMDFFNDIFHNLALLEFYFLNIIYILLYIDFILSIFFQHSNILTRASHHWCLASNIVLVVYQWFTAGFWIFYANPFCWWYKSLCYWIQSKWYCFWNQ